MALIELFLTFFKIGAFTLGGGFAMLPLIQAEAQRHGWMTQEELVDFVALSESTPGPLAVNMATFIGMRACGLPGAAIASLGIVLPAFLIILIVAKCFAKFQNSKAVGGILSGLKPAVAGMIGAAFLSVAGTVFFPAGLDASNLTNASFWVLLGTFVLSAVLAFKKIHPIKIILLAAVIGIGAGYGMGL